MSKPRRNTSLADMSLPPEERRRRRRPGRIATPPAQMDHANGPRAARHRRDGERWLAAEERLREDAAGFAAEAGELDTEAALGRMWQRVQDAAADG